MEQMKKCVSLVCYSEDEEEVYVEETPEVKQHKAKKIRPDVLLELIELYKSEPCLWKVKSKDYCNRDKKANAYKKLLRKYKELYPFATIEDVKKKINNLRSNFRKELKKIEASKKSGVSTDDLYEPTLWYYTHLLFLTDQETPAPSITNISSSDDEEDVRNDMSTQAYLPISSPNCLAQSSSNAPRYSPISSTFSVNSPPLSLQRKRNSKNMAAEVLGVIKEKLNEPTRGDDYFDLVAKTWASKLRRLDPQMRILAEKEVNDMLFEAEMGFLSNPNQQFTPTSNYNSNYHHNQQSTAHPIPSPSTLIPPDDTNNPQSLSSHSWNY